MTGMGNLALGLIQGVDTADRFYSRRNAEGLANARDQRDQARFGMQQETFDLEKEIRRREVAGQKLYALSLDSEGRPRKFTREDNGFINQHVVPVMNEGGIFSDFLTANPEVDQINPIARLDISDDGRVMIGLKMRDGSVKPATVNRSSDPNDPLWAPTVQELMRITQIEADPRGTAARIAERQKRTYQLEDYTTEKAIDNAAAKDLAQNKLEREYKLKTALEKIKSKLKSHDVTPSQSANNAEIDAAREAIRGLSRDEILTRTQEATATGRDNPDYDPYLAGLVKKATQRKTGNDSEFEQIHRQFYGSQPAAQQAPPAAVEYLRQNPQLKNQFQQKYGYLPEGF